jgi:hypothetical protein
MPERISQTRTRGQRAESHPGFIRQISSAGRVIGVVVWPVFLACWSLNSFAIDYHFDPADASHAMDSRSEKSASCRSPRLVQSSPQSTPLSEAIYQNTPGNSQGYPEGLSWDKGFYGTSTLKPAPSGFSALTGWAVVYPEAGARVNADAASDTVQVANFTTYVHLTDGTWLMVQDQAEVGIQGAHYVADFSGDANIPFSKQTLPDGSVSIDAPVAGCNDHFWPTARGTYPHGTVDGVFAEADMKTNDPSANLVAQLGGDWWRNDAAPYVAGFANNPAIGGATSPN